MSSSEICSDKTFSSNESEPDYVDEYELEVEQFDVGSTSPSPEARGKVLEDSVAAAASIFPYKCDPIAQPRIGSKIRKGKGKTSSKPMVSRAFVIRNNTASFM